MLWINSRYLIFYQLEEVGEAPRTPGIYIPPSVSIPPQIPPPPSRPPPPIPQTSFVSKENNQLPPSPGRDSEQSAPPSYDYSSFLTSSPITALPTFSLTRPVTSPLPHPVSPPPPPQGYFPPPTPSRTPPPPPVVPPAVPSMYTHPPLVNPPHPPPPPPSDFLDMPS